MLTFSALSEQTLDKIHACDWDRIIEKHEGPESWESFLRYYAPEFMEIAGRSVLLPVRQEQHTNITILRCLVSSDGNSLTVFLKDTTYCPDPQHEAYCAGYLAVCDRIAGEDFFIAVVYHEWFIIQNDNTGRN